MIAFLNKKWFPAAFFCSIFFFSLVLYGLLEETIVILIPFVLLFAYWAWGNMQRIFLLLLLSLMFSFEYSFSGSFGTDFPDELLMLLTALLFFCYWIYKPSALSKKIFNHPLFIALAFVFAWMVITVIFSTDKILSVKYLLAKSWYLGAFVLAPLIFVKDKKAIRTIGFILGISILSIAIIVLFREYRRGLRFAEVNEAIAPFFRNHVTYSAMVVCLSPLFFAYYNSIKTRSKKRVAGVATAILLLALLLSYARGAWLALVLGLIAYWLINNRLLVIAYLIGIISIIGALIWLRTNDNYLKFSNDYNSTIFHTNFQQHLVATYELKDVSTAERFYRWVAGVRMVKDNWLSGYGPNTFYYNYQPYALLSFKTWVSNNPDHSTVHNYFLLTCIEQGVPGLILFLILIGLMLYYAQSLYHRLEDPFYKTAAKTIGVIIVMILVVNFLSDLIETDKIGSLFYMCLALLITIDINGAKKLQPSPHIQSIPQAISE
jgi:O-antigen ligase